jgi:hypothetical protein
VKRLRTFFVRLFASFGALRNVQSLSAEIDEHLKLLADEYLAQGFSPEEARRRAALKSVALPASEKTIASRMASRASNRSSRTRGTPSAASANPRSSPSPPSSPSPSASVSLPQSSRSFTPFCSNPLPSPSPASSSASVSSRTAVSGAAIRRAPSFPSFPMSSTNTSVRTQRVSSSSPHFRPAAAAICSA